MKNELTPRQKEAMALLLIRIGSWTSARWTSHLRNMIGDEEAEPLIAWVRAQFDLLPAQDGSDR